MLKLTRVEENTCTIENGLSDKTNEPHEKFGNTKGIPITQNNDTDTRYKNKDGLMYVDIESGNNGLTLITCTSTNANNSS